MAALQRLVNASIAALRNAAASTGSNGGSAAPAPSSNSSGYSAPPPPPQSPASDMSGGYGVAPAYIRYTSPGPGLSAIAPPSNSSSNSVNTTSTLGSDGTLSYRNLLTAAQRPPVPSNNSNNNGNGGGYGGMGGGYLARANYTQGEL